MKKENLHTYFEKCNQCAYAVGKKSCGVMKQRINNCWGYADEAEKARREQAIKEYSDNHRKV